MMQKYPYAHLWLVSKCYKGSKKEKRSLTRNNNNCENIVRRGNLFKVFRSYRREHKGGYLTMKNTWSHKCLIAKNTVISTYIIC